MPTCTFEYKGSEGVVKEDLKVEDATVEVLSELFSLEPESIRLLGDGRVIRQKNGVFEGLISGKTYRYRVMGTNVDSSVQKKTTSTFAREGKNAIEVNVEGVDDLAEKLAKMFSLEVDTIELFGDGDLFEQDKRGLFHGLKNGKTYEVLGRKKKMEVCLKLPPEDLQAVGREVANETRVLLENEDVLVRAPAIATFVRTLCLLARALPRDVSLITKDAKFNFLNNPNSLAACLYQVKAAICNLTQLSNSKMLSISLALSNIPENYRMTEEALRNACEGDKESADETLRNVKRNLQGTARNCREWANEVKDEAIKVNKVIAELQGAVIATEGRESGNLKEAERKLKELEQRRIQRVEEAKLLEEEVDRKRKIAEEAAEMYQEKLSACSVGGSMFLLAVGDMLGVLCTGAVDAAKDLVSIPTSLMKAVNETVVEEARKAVKSNSTKAAKALRKAAVATLADCVEKTVDRLGGDELSSNNREEIIASFKMALEVTGDADDKISSMLTKQVRKAIESLTEIGKEEESSEEGRRKDHREVGEELQIALRNYRAAVAIRKSQKDQKHLEKLRLKTAREQTKQGLIASAQAAMKSAQEEKKEADAQREDASRRMREATREIDDIVCQIGSIDFEKIELKKVVSYLDNAIKLIERLEADFSGMADFFDKFAALIRLKFSANTTSFLQSIFHVAQKSVEEGNKEGNKHSSETNAEGGDPIFTTMKSITRENVVTINRWLLKSIGFSMQIEKVANLYLEISKKYVMPTISGQQKTFGLTKQEAQLELENIQEDLHGTNTAVKSLVEQRMGIEGHCSVAEALEAHQNLAIENKK